ncbi:hypothetical protein F511_42587 [Dorcoceras hygrometricum]|uniref:Uncharacterized protein n=1 Tax=Dorcoceras hygrometricum TaxID=472368 RepID=A0A2Z7AIU3_9LAMI|nr:hypothetical protein F511_42587 [Dorcoceras hygrometricum]
MRRLSCVGSRGMVASPVWVTVVTIRCRGRRRSGGGGSMSVLAAMVEGRDLGELFVIGGRGRRRRALIAICVWKGDETQSSCISWRLQSSNVLEKEASGGGRLSGLLHVKPIFDLFFIYLFFLSFYFFYYILYYYDKDADGSKVDENL